MSNVSRRVDGVWLIFPVTVLIALVTACGNRQIEWKEEVKLKSGEVVVVKRTAKSKRIGEIGGPGGWENEGMTVQIIQPIKPDNPPSWNAKFVPLVFDRDPDTKEWFVVATFYSCTSWYELGRPRLPHTEFRLTNGQWRQQPLSPDLIGREGNMVTNIRLTGEPDHTVADKEGINNDPVIPPDLKRVVAVWATTC